MFNRTTMSVVSAQIAAMKVALFEVGAYKPSADSLNATPEMFLRTWDQAALSRSINWLRLQNLKGRNIYIRPRGEHPLTLLDDLTAEAIEKMKSEGFDPAVVVETSAGNFQAWVHHGEVLPKKLSTRAAKILANRFGGDPSSADWRHFGRLAGFTNRKDKYRDGRGLFPFVKLIDANGRVYPGAREFLSELRTACQLADRRLQAFPYRVASVHPHRLRTISDFRSKPEYQNDGNRVDLAYAIYALSHGISEDEVRATIASRDLSHKGNTQRQLDYVNRTVQKASVTVQDRSSER